MQKNEVVVLPVTPNYINDLWALLGALAKDKSVLNVGAAGNVEYYLDGRRELWMHDQLKTLASGVVGLDIDEESVRYANAHGENITLGNCESIQLGQKFDLVVLSEVIEHVNAPVMAIDNLARHLKPGGKIFITTPNPTHYGTVLRALLFRSQSIYYDHVAAFFPENLVVVCRRLGLRVSGIHYYNVVDRRTANMRFRSFLARQVGRVFHRFSSNFIFIIDAP